MPCSRCGVTVQPDAARCPTCGTSWTDAKRVAMTVVLLLGFNALVSLGSAVYLTRVAHLLGTMTYDSYAASAVGNAMTTYGATLGISVMLMAVTAPFFLAWLWQARRIADARGTRLHDRSRVISAWFLPGRNLWLPPRIVREVWLATAPAYATAERQFAALTVRAWWLVLSGGLILQAGFALGSTTALDQALLLTSVQLAGSSAVSLAAVLCMLIVYRISRLQSVRQSGE